MRLLTTTLLALALAACGADDGSASSDAAADGGLDADGLGSSDVESGDIGSGDSGSGDSGADGTAPPVDPRTAAFEPSEPRMFRLTSAQYRNTIADIFGDEIVVSGSLEPDLPASGFLAIGAGTATISPRGVEQYERAAYEIAEQFVEGDSALLEICTPTGAADAGCARRLLERIGLLTWRRPLDAGELDALVDVVTTVGAAEGAFEVGLRYGIAALLQSPWFLFRAEVGEPASGERVLTGWELASRLSYFLWNSTPDDALLEAAATGELSTDEGLERQARRMLDDPRAIDGVRNFFTEYLQLDQLDGLRKDPDVFTHMSPELGPAAREETLRLVEDFAFESEGDFRDLFTTRRTFIDRSLAALYDVPAPSREGFAETVLPADSPRRGLLGHASFLALHSHPVSSSATLRGRFVRETLLCGVIPPPPVNVDTSIPEPSADAPTLRERVAVHLEVDSCAGCHLLMDPIGLGLETFDGLGRYRSTEAGAVIDASGELDGVMFDDASELAEAVADHPSLASCFVRSVFRYANGRADESGDAELLAALSGWWERDADRRIQPLLVELVMSPAFRRVAEFEVTEEVE